MNTFGSVVLTQDLQPMRPQRPLSQLPQYGHDTLVRDHQERQKRDSQGSSNISLTGMCDKELITKGGVR